MYTIGQVSERFDLPVSTLRYYDKEGLFPDLTRTSGIRRFGERVEAEIERLQKSLDMIRFKCWYYEQAMRDGNEDRVHAMLPDRLPPDIQPIYDHAHET
jgi:transcriptional regulator, merR family